MTTPKGGNPTLLMVLFALWLLVFGGSFAAYTFTEPTGEGFVRGMNRVVSFLGWQGLAAAFAVAIWSVGRHWPKGSAARRLSQIPGGVALLLFATIAGVILWAGF